VVLLGTGRIGVVSSVLAFGGTASVAAAFGLLQSRVRPRPGQVRSWVVTHRSLGARYAAENVSVSAGFQIRAFALGATTGLVAVGDVRAAELLMGPFLVILMGISIVAVPEASLALRSAPQRLARFCLRLGLGLAIGAAVWGAMVFVLLPTGLGAALVGSIWVAARALLPPVVIAVAVSCMSTAASAGLRAMGAARRSLAAGLVASGLYVAGGVGGAVLAGAPGTCWGVAIAASIAGVAWWAQLWRTVGDFLASVHAPENLRGTLTASPLEPSRILPAQDPS
jgi:O-antigen/teichoic acid export membrane protein